MRNENNADRAAPGIVYVVRVLYPGQLITKNPQKIVSLRQEPTKCFMKMTLAAATTSTTGCRRDWVGCHARTYAYGRGQRPSGIYVVTRMTGTVLPRAV